jgi:hypothetical protein
MMPFFRPSMSCTTASLTLAGKLPAETNSSEVNQRLNLRTVRVGPLIEEGEPTTATR